MAGDQAEHIQLRLQPSNVQAAQELQATGSSLSVLQTALDLLSTLRDLCALCCPFCWLFPSLPLSDVDEELILKKPNIGKQGSSDEESHHAASSGSDKLKSENNEACFLGTEGHLGRSGSIDVFYSKYEYDVYYFGIILIQRR